MAIELVLGLGNPGEDYAGTRHNVGFRVVEEVARRHGVFEWIERSSSEVAAITVGRLVVLARPQTFMNRSGEAARWLLDEFDVTPEAILVVVDDIDLPLASLRLRRSGGPGSAICAKRSGPPSRAFESECEATSCREIWPTTCSLRFPNPRQRLRTRLSHGPPMRWSQPSGMDSKLR